MAADAGSGLSAEMQEVAGLSGIGNWSAVLIGEISHNPDEVGVGRETQVGVRIVAEPDADMAAVSDGPLGHLKARSVAYVDRPGLPRRDLFEEGRAHAWRRRRPAGCGSSGEAELPEGWSRQDAAFPEPQGAADGAGLQTTARTRTFSRRKAVSSAMR